MEPSATSSTVSTYNPECPISIKWTISEEKLEALKESNNGYLETEIFNASNIPGVQYNLTLCPNGDQEKRRRQVWIFLQIQLGNETKIKADVNFSVESAGFTRKINYKYVKSMGRGIEIRCTSEFFDPEKSFISDGKFTLKCEGILSVQREKLTDNNNGIVLDDGHIGYKLWNNSGKDFTIKVGENAIQVHKSVLASQSPIFKAIFRSLAKKSKQNQMVIKDFSFKVVETAVQICYNVATLDVLDLNDKSELLLFCNKYDISDLKNRCEASLIQNVSISNVCQLTKCSLASNAPKLEEKCAEILIKSLKSGTPIIDIDLLENDFIRKIFSNLCCNLVVT